MSNMSMKEVMEYVDAKVDTVYKDGYDSGFRDGAESMRKLIETIIKFSRGDASWTELKEAEQKLIESQKGS